MTELIRADGHHGLICQCCARRCVCFLSSVWLLRWHFRFQFLYTSILFQPFVNVFVFMDIKIFLFLRTFDWHSFSLSLHLLWFNAKASSIHGMHLLEVCVLVYMDCIFYREYALLHAKALSLRFRFCFFLALLCFFQIIYAIGRAALTKQFIFNEIFMCCLYA